MSRIPKLVIRDMQTDDIPSVLEIEQRSFSCPWSREIFLHELCKKFSLLKVAEFERAVIGYLCADYFAHESNILDLAVHPDFRRQGVATRLMDEAVGELKQKGCVFLHLKVRVSNTGAQKFYEHLGFVTEGVRKNYYEKPDEDALQMMGRV
ncbi:MAG: ribosomal protein S18-alanine N-acetyltransferase [Nitrospirota bacterium]